MISIDNLNLVVTRRLPPRPRPNDWIPTAQLTVSFTANVSSETTDEIPWRGEIFMMGADGSQSDDLFQMTWIEWGFTGRPPFRWETQWANRFFVYPQAGSTQSYAFQMTVPTSRLDEDRSKPTRIDLPNGSLEINVPVIDEVFAQVRLTSGDRELPPVNSNIETGVFERPLTR